MTAERQPPVLKIIGTVNGDIMNLDEAPKGYDESERTGYLEISPEFAEGLEGIEAGQWFVRPGLRVGVRL